jgi:hypothetical protein
MSPIINFNSYPALYPHIQIRSNDETYSLIKYNKQDITPQNIFTLGLYRSVIVKKEDGHIVCVSPPKSVSPEWFMETYSPNSVVAEEFIDGTMINTFWDVVNNKWMVNTKSTVGAQCCYYVSQTFEDMFKDACVFCNLQLDNLDKTLCYSFILQHPNNRIVVRIKHPQIYLIRVYKIHSYNQVEQIDLPDNNYDFRQMGIGFENSSVQIPARYTFTTYDELIERFATAWKTPYNILGVVISHGHLHCKIRNPTYLHVQYLRGKTPRMDYHYLWLRKNNILSDFFIYFPEYKSEMLSLRKSLHTFTGQLFSNYVNCYIYKKNKIDYFNEFYQRHMKQLHHIYITTLLPLRKSISMNIVIDYVNMLDINIQVTAIRYNLDV